MDYVSSNIGYSEATVGYCSLCGGEVRVATVYHSIIPPVPKCSNCGAVERKKLPILDMEKPLTVTKTTTTNKTTICGPYCDWPYCNCENYK